MATRIINGSGHLHCRTITFAAPSVVLHHQTLFFPLQKSPQICSSVFSLKAKKIIDKSSGLGSVNRRRNLNNLEVEVLTDDFLVVSFYKFVSIEKPEAEVSKHLTFLQRRDIHGRIYINEQGINAQTSPSLYGHAFPRLKLRYKPSLVQYEGGTLHLPLLDPSMRACPLAPSEWRRRLQSENEHSTIESISEYKSNLKRKVLLLDVRNDNHFEAGYILAQAMSGMLVTLKEHIDLMWTVFG